MSGEQLSATSRRTVPVIRRLYTSGPGPGRGTGIAETVSSDLKNIDRIRAFTGVDQPWLVQLGDHAVRDAGLAGHEALHPDATLAEVAERLQRVGGGVVWERAMGRAWQTERVRERLRRSGGMVRAVAAGGRVPSKRARGVRMSTRVRLPIQARAGQHLLGRRGQQDLVGAARDGQVDLRAEYDQRCGNGSELHGVSPIGSMRALFGCGAGRAR